MFSVNHVIGMCKSIESLDSTLHGIASVGKSQAKLNTKTDCKFSCLDMHLLFDFLKDCTILVHAYQMG